MVPTERGSELCPFRGIQHWPADGEHRSDTGEATMCLCVCGFTEQISGFACENVTWPVSYSCLIARNSSPLSWVQLGLLGSLLLHAWVLYFTELIRSAKYQLPGGLETSLWPLLPLLIRRIYLMWFSDQWGFTHYVWPVKTSTRFYSCFVYAPICICVWVHTH